MSNAGRPARTWRAAASTAALCLAWNAPSLAASSTAELLGCRTIADSAARLACFDREAAALAGAAGAAGAGGSAPPAAMASPTAATGTAGTAGRAGTGGTPAPAAPSAVPAPRPAPVLDREQQFGLPESTVAAKEVAAGTRAADAQKIEAHLAKVATSADGRAVFTLDNAQVWRQLEPQGDEFSKPGDAVTISRGLLGSYWLQPKSGRGCKVTRLR